MSKHSGKIGLYFLLIVALIAGYLYLNDQVSTQGSYTMGQLEKDIEVTISSTNIQKKDFLWTTSLNFGHNSNKVTELTGEIGRASCRERV